MRKNPTYDIEDFRVTVGPLASNKSFGANGAFIIDGPSGPLKIVCSDGSDWEKAELPGTPWEHVSVSCPERCPTWQEMDHVKHIFWRDDELVLQFHVPRAHHINCHEHCLHLWKPVGVTIPQPPSITVGPHNSR